MTSLLDKTLRDTLGIDILERGILFGIVGLKIVYRTIALSLQPQESQELLNRVLVTYALDSINISLSVPLNLTFYEINGGDFIESLITTANTLPEYGFNNLEPTENIKYPILADPLFLNGSLEKYTVWAISELENRLKGDTSEGEALIRIDQNNGNVIASATIPYNRYKYLKNRNLIEAVKEIIFTTVPNDDPGDGVINSFFNDINTLNDAFLLNN